MKFCICLAVYKYTSNASRSQTTLASLSPAAQGFPAATSTGGGVWLESPAAAAAHLEGTVTGQTRSSTTDSCSSWNFPVQRKVSTIRTQVSEVFSQLIKQASGDLLLCAAAWLPMQADNLQGSYYSVITKLVITFDSPLPTFRPNLSQGQGQIR